MASAALVPPAAATLSSPARLRLAGAEDGRLFFGEVLEDPALEVAWLRPRAGRRLVVVGSGGCTAFALLAAGAGEVVSVDRNATQHHLVELKLAALALPADDALRFLGGIPAPARRRTSTYALLRDALSPAARAYWDARPGDVRRGAIRSAVTERFLGPLAKLVRAAAVPRARILRLRACSGTAEQQALFASEWNTWRWRGLFPLLLNRWILRRALDPAFFRQLPPEGLSAHFRAKLEHGLRDLPAAGNYFLDRLLLGRYLPGGPRPVHATTAGVRALRQARGRLSLVDGTMTAYLRTCPDASVHGFALSNICEWLEPAEVDALFAEVARAAVPGAPVCVRNFVGAAHVPAAWRDVVREDGRASARLGDGDRSLVNRTFHACVVAARPTFAARRPRPQVREAQPADNAALLALTAACPMEGPLALRLDRAPDYFAFTRLAGGWSRVGVAPGAAGELDGCVAVAERRLHLGGAPTRTFYASDLRVRRAARGRGAADALVHFVAASAAERAGRDATVWMVVLAGNRSMEARVAGPRGLPRLTRCARIETHALLLLRPPRAESDALDVHPADATHLGDMAALWTDVAPRRHFTACLDGAAFAGAVNAPGLGPGAFHLARERSGRLAGFLGVWDQSAVKRWVITRDSARTRLTRAAHNGLARALGAPRLGGPGQPLLGASVFMACVPPERPDVLRALLAAAGRRLRRDGIPLLHLALDARDPLRAALRGTSAVATPFDLYLSSPAGRLAGPLPDGRPCHFEVALS